MKSLGKTKRVSVWCNDGKSIPLPKLGGSGERRRNKIIKVRYLPVKVKIGPGQYKFDFTKSRKIETLVSTIPSFVRCPNCNGKFKPSLKDCGDGNCWHASIRPHKHFVKVSNV